MGASLSRRLPELISSRLRIVSSRRRCRLSGLRRAGFTENASDPESWSDVRIGLAIRGQLMFCEDPRLQDARFPVGRCPPSEQEGVGPFDLPVASTTPMADWFTGAKGAKPAQPDAEGSLRGAYSRGSDLRDSIAPPVQVAAARDLCSLIAHLGCAAGTRGQWRTLGGPRRHPAGQEWGAARRRGGRRSI
jgi:hypothetical protein